MDAIRTLSMGQVILGHMFVYCMSSSGFSNMEQFSPPHGLLGSFWFQLIPGCFYGVDSFFVLSGFLCAYSLERKVFNKPENKRPRGFSLTYLKFLLLRWLRLVPTEMFCIFFTLYILPYIGTGILWNMDRVDGRHCFDAAGGAGCEKAWWKNLLFLQDVDGGGMCYGHTWYLANDFQLYMTAPFFALAYSLDRRLGWGLLLAGLAVGVTIPMVLTAHYDWVPEVMAGAFKGFDSKFYMKPWCRCPAFFVGIAAGWLWPEQLEQYKGRHTSAKSRLVSVSWAIVGFLLCFAATFGRMAFWQCDLTACSDPDKSPVNKFFQYLWAGFSILAWCLGLTIMMVLNFQGRFLPFLQGFLSLDGWQALSKLTYSAYLIHPTILILDYCQRNDSVTFSASQFAFKYVSFVVVALLAALCVYMVVEKPIANLQMRLLGGSEG